MKSRSIAAPLALVVACLSCGTAPTPNVKSPEFPDDKNARCSVKKSQANPLVVEWPSADRATLEARSRRAIVPVRYVGCEMEVLRQCAIAGQYAYTALNKQKESMVVRDVDELYAKLPLGAAGLEGTLRSAGSLGLAMTMVGRYEWTGSPRYKDLQGQDCERATHVVSALIVGAFDFFSGKDSEVGAGVALAGVGAGGKTITKRETINEAGDESACARSTTKDVEPPNDCGATLRVEVMPIADAPAFAADVPAQAAPAPVATAPAATAPAATAQQPAATTQRLVVMGAAVRDTQTGLTWQRTWASAKSFWDAEGYCDELQLGSAEPWARSNLLAQGMAPAPRRRGEWRIPTVSELTTLKGVDTAMRGGFWAADRAMARAPVNRGNLLAQESADRSWVEFPLGVAHRGQYPSDKRNVRCVK
jgi:hypothetical protein